MKKAFCFGLLAAAVALSFLSCKNNNSDLKKVTKVSLSETIKIIEVGEEFTLKETVEPVDAVDRGVVWSSDKPNVATVKDGKVKGIAEGEATITVTTNDGNKTADCKVVVTAAAEKAGLDSVYYLKDAVEGAYLYEISLITPEDAIDEEGNVQSNGTLYVFTINSTQPVNDADKPAMGNYVVKAEVAPMAIMTGKSWKDVEYSYTQTFDFQGYLNDDIKPIKSGILYLEDQKIVFYGEDTENKINIKYSGDYKIFNNAPWKFEPKTPTTIEVAFTKAKIYSSKFESSQNLHLACEEKDKILLVDFFITHEADVFTQGVYQVEPNYGKSAIGTMQKSPGCIGNQLWQMSSMLGMSVENGIPKNIYFFDKGQAVVTDKKIEFNVTSHFGSTLKITYTGDLSFKKQWTVVSTKGQRVSPLKQTKKRFF